MNYINEKNDTYYIIENRDNVIDTLKGWGICLMVCGHSGAPLTHFIYLFHMALFFIASGYLWKEKVDSSSGLVNYVLKKLKTLYIPFVLINGFYTISSNLFLKLGIYSNKNGGGILAVDYLSTQDVVKKLIQNIFFSGGSQLGGATWFLRSLFFVTIFNEIFHLLLRKIKKENYYLILSLTFSIIGIILYQMQISLVVNVLSIVGLQSFFMAYFAYLLGIILKKLDIMKKIVHHKKSVFTMSVFILLILNNLGSIEMNVGKDTNVIYYLIVSLAGWNIIYIVSSLKNSLNYKLSYIGKKSIWILGLHFLCFKLISLLYIFITNKPIILLAHYPVIKDIHYLWILYTVIGIAIPLLIERMICLLKKCIWLSE